MIANFKYKIKISFKIGLYQQIDQNQQSCMTEQTIDFGNFSRKIIVNPIVPLQIINLKCRNSHHRIQATIIGKIYSSHIDILDIVPVAICQENKVKTIDFVQHQRSLQNILTVYPSLQIIGVAVTDLKPQINLAALHTMYVNKESGFKSQGILTYPIILSIGTTFDKKANNFDLTAYCFNQTYRFCKDLMDVTSFEKFDVTISLGEADFQSMVPLFQAFNDQQRLVPEGNASELMKILAVRLKELKLRCEKQQGEQLKLKLRQIVSRVSSKKCISTEQLSYLLDLAGLQKRISLKMNKFF